MNHLATPNEARFRLLVENIGDVLWFKELDPPRFSYVSTAFERIWGFGVDELHRRPALWDECIHPEDRKAVREALQQWFDGDKADYDAHYRVICRDGQVRWIADRGIILGRKDGKPYQIGGIARDITEHEAAEAIRKRLAAVVESSDDAIITLDLEGVIQTWNAGAERIFQYSAEEAVGKSVSFLRPPQAADDEAVFRRYIRRGKRIEHYETHRQRKDGRIIDLSISISPLKDAAGHLTGFSKISRDITQRNVDRRMFDRLLEAAPDGFVILDALGCMWLANARAERLFGIPRKAMIGKAFEMMLAPGERDRFGNLRQDFLARPDHSERFRGMELAGLRKDGGEFPMEISLSQVETPDGGDHHRHHRHHRAKKRRTNDSYAEC
jgi:PAS domain S-box-containing protein